jgi:hypothetical protein
MGVDEGWREEMRIVKGVGKFTGIFALGEFPHRWGGISRSRIRGFEKDGELRKVGCLQLFIRLSFFSFSPPSCSPFCSFVFTENVVWLTRPYVFSLFLVSYATKRKKKLIYTVSQYVYFFLSLTTFYYTKFTTYFWRLNISASDPCTCVFWQSRLCAYICKHIKTKQTRWFLVRERTIRTERPPLVGEF